MTDMETLKSTTFGQYIGNCKWFNSKIGYGFATIVSKEIIKARIFLFIIVVLS